MPIILVIVPGQETGIKTITIEEIRVTFEHHKRKRRTGQCFNCQKFGNSAMHCKAPSVCRHCAENHESRNHQKKSEVPNKCINCDGDHKSNYYERPMFPKRENEEKAVPKRYRKPYRTPEKSEENNNPHNVEDTPLNNMLSALEELKELLRKRPILAEMILLKNFPGLPGNRD
ncbi:hypothetical protein JTB14_032902 [Gonioctena quinquepunctata]|nr:hypothetical protein JTB14_032902 [Gonioctena quinquepunctata]